MKKWQCSICFKKILAFTDDVKAGGEFPFATITTAPFDFVEHVCDYVPINEWKHCTIHGEAGWMTEDTMLDSMSTIHDAETKNIMDAEDFRELKQLNEGCKGL